MLIQKDGVFINLNNVVKFIVDELPSWNQTKDEKYAVTAILINKDEDIVFTCKKYEDGISFVKEILKEE